MSRISNAHRLSDTFGLELPPQQQQQGGDEGDRLTSDIFHTGFPDVFGSGMGIGVGGGLQSGSGAIGRFFLFSSCLGIGFLQRHW